MHFSEERIHNFYKSFKMDHNKKKNPKNQKKKKKTPQELLF